VRFAYADPPYLGTSKFGAQHHYGHHHADAAAYDTIEGHEALIETLVADFPDGWAMSLSSPSLRLLLPLCPSDVRVGAWVKPFASFKPGVNPGYCWEPVIWRGGRKRERYEDTVRDWCSENIMLKKGLSGAKPPNVCRWVLELLGYREGDALIDLFPGTGVMAETLAQGVFA
jgi:hypothetical protein